MRSAGVVNGQMLKDFSGWLSIGQHSLDTILTLFRAGRIGSLDMTIMRLVSSRWQFVAYYCVKNVDCDWKLVCVLGHKATGDVDAMVFEFRYPSAFGRCLME